MQTFPAQFDWQSCCDRITEDIARLREEITVLTREYDRTDFFGLAHHLPNALHGYLMACMSKIDFLSLCHDPAMKNKQTERMVRFLNTYVQIGRNEESEILVQMCRHTLMHSGDLRFVLWKKRNAIYTWRIHWSPSTGGIHHYTVTDEDPTHQEQLLSVCRWAHPGVATPRTRCINIILTLFAEYIQNATTRFLAQVSASTQMQANMVEAYRLVAMQVVDRKPKKVQANSV